MAEPISLVHVDLSEAAVAAAAEVLRSGHLRSGEVTARFEQAFAEAVGARHAVACASGSVALLLAYLALFTPGDEVLVPAFTHFSTVAMLHLAGATPVLCDVDPRSWTIDPVDAARRVTSRTQGLVAVHLYGNPAAVADIYALADRHGLAVVWDAAQAHLSRWAQGDVGCLGQATCYSFYATKTMTTGEGGMVTTPDPQLAQRLRRLRQHGENGRYRHLELGINGRLTDFAAAIGLVELADLPARVAGRRQCAAELDAAAATVPGLITQATPPGGVHSYHQYTLRVEPSRLGRDRDQLAQWLAGLGIETAGLESEGRFQAELFVSRPKEDVLAAPLGQMVTVVSGRNRTVGTRYVRVGRGERAQIVRAPS